MKIIGILTGCDSDKHLSEPVFNELEKIKLKPIFIPLIQNSITMSYNAVSYILEDTTLDFILAVGDRLEQLGGVLASFHNKIPIGHLYAGDHNTIATFDDIHRHAITLYSNIQFCSCFESTVNTEELMCGAGLKSNANYVGATHFDGIDINNLPMFGIEQYKPYTLILINSETLNNDKALIDEIETDNFIYTQNILIAKGNNDNEEIETTIFNALRKKTNCSINIIRENRKDHLYFLSLIKNCEQFITNSSAVIYEAPFLIDQSKIIHVGNRNKNRTHISYSAHDGHASERIAKLIKEFLEKRK